MRGLVQLYRHVIVAGARLERNLRFTVLGQGSFEDELWLLPEPAVIVRDAIECNLARQVSILFRSHRPILAQSNKFRLISVLFFREHLQQRLTLVQWLSVRHGLCLGFQITALFVQLDVVCLCNANIARLCLAHSLNLLLIETILTLALIMGRKRVTVINFFIGNFSMVHDQSLLVFSDKEMS